MDFFFLESSYFFLHWFYLYSIYFHWSIFIFLPFFWTTEATFHLSVTQRRHNWEKKVTLFFGATLLPLKLMLFRSIKEMCLLQKNNLKFGLGKYELCSRSLYSPSLRRSIVYMPPIPAFLPPKVTPPRIRLWMKGFDWAVSQLANCGKGSPVNVC